MLIMIAYSSSCAVFFVVASCVERETGVRYSFWQKLMLAILWPYYLSKVD